MRILGVDYGAVRIGLAISDPLGLTAQALATVADIAGLKQAIAPYEPIDKIVVGLPKKMSGELGPQAVKVKAFVAELEKELGLPVITWDERLTTSQAEKMLISAGLSRQKRRKVIDRVAAAEILQSYLDQPKKT